MFAIAAETGWTEKRVLFMPLARLAQYQHCLFRRNGVRTHWSNSNTGGPGLREQLQALKIQWQGVVTCAGDRIADVVDGDEPRAP